MPRCFQFCEEQDAVSELVMMIDSDFVAQTEEVQGVGSGESEFIASVRGWYILLCARTIPMDQRHPLNSRAATDSTVVEGVAECRGVEELRHLHPLLLQLQLKPRSGDTDVSNIGTGVNMSDLGAKVQRKIERMHDSLWIRAEIWTVEISDPQQQSDYEDCDRQSVSRGSKIVLSQQRQRGSQSVQRPLYPASREQL